MQKHRMH